MNGSRFPRWLLVGAVLLTGCERSEREPDLTRPAGAGSQAVPAPPADSLGQRPEDAAATMRAYLAAWSQGDHARAASLWAEGATAGAGDSAAFRRAHGDTTVTGFTVGAPGPVGAAAGSRYVEIPVIMQGTTPGRPPLRLHGRATLRHAVVDGATEAQRRWRISRLEWSSNAKPPQQP